MSLPPIPPPPPGFVYTQPKRKRNWVLIWILAIAGFVVCITALLICMTLAIPAMQKVIRTGNETSAITSLHMLNEAETQYNATYPQHGFACSLHMLGGQVGSAAPSVDAAQLVAPDLAAGNKAGYTFTLTCGGKTISNNADLYNSYTLTAVPNSLGHSGNRGFCTDENAQIRFDPKGGTNCTELLP